MQIVLPELILDPPVVDIRRLPENEREKEAKRIASEEGVRPFDLSRGPLVRAGVVRMGDREHWLLITVHYIVFQDAAGGYRGESE